MQPRSKNGARTSLIRQTQMMRKSSPQLCRRGVAVPIGTAVFSTSIATVQYNRYSLINLIGTSRIRLKKGLDGKSVFPAFATGSKIRFIQFSGWFEVDASRSPSDSKI